MRKLKSEFKKITKNSLLLEEMYKNMGLNFIGAYSYKNYNIIVTEDPKEFLKCISVKNMEAKNKSQLLEDDIAKITEKFGIIEYEISGTPDITKNDTEIIYNSLYIFEKHRLN